MVKSLVTSCFRANLLLLLLSIFNVFLLSYTPAEARVPRGYTCGIVMRQLTGNIYGPEFNLARNWLRLPRISVPTIGAVVVQSRAGRALGGGLGGHVSRIVSLSSNCRAVVQDNRGTYERDICRNLLGYVIPGGSIDETRKAVAKAPARQRSARIYERAIRSDKSSVSSRGRYVNASPNVPVPF